MKALKFFLLFALIGGFFATANASFSSTNATDVVVTEDDPMSEMVLKVTSIVGNEREANKVKKTLMRLEGVTNVSLCTESGTVRVAYNKPQLGCCSRIHSQLQSSGISYEMVSNNEAQRCGSAQGQNTNSNSGNGSCTGRSSGATSTAPSCCQQRRNS